MTGESGSAERLPVILLVDDERVFRLLARQALQQAGFEIAEAQGGEEALEALRGGLEPALILLDLVMPGKDGFAVSSEIRRIRRLEHVPILIMTGLEDYDSIKRAYESGATDFITKPINWPARCWTTSLARSKARANSSPPRQPTPPAPASCPGR